MFGNDSLDDYYRTNFVLIHHYKYSLTELENMMPWEREIYITLLKDHLQKLKEQES